MVTSPVNHGFGCALNIGYSNNDDSPMVLLEALPSSKKEMAHLPHRCICISIYIIIIIKILFVYINWYLPPLPSCTRILDHVGTLKDILNHLRLWLKPYQANFPKNKHIWTRERLHCPVHPLLPSSGSAVIVSRHLCSTRCETSYARRSAMDDRTYGKNTFTVYCEPRWNCFLQ